MQCHTTESNGFFNCKSYFQPVVEVCPISDPIPEDVKKKEEVKYLPGERLLIKLNKEKQKKKNNIDVERITQSLQRILPI